MKTTSLSYLFFLVAFANLGQLAKVHAQSNDPIRNWTGHQSAMEVNHRAQYRTLFATFLPSVQLSLAKDANGIVVTGIASIDSLNAVYGCTSIVKRFSGKTEAVDWDLDKSYLLNFAADIDVVAARVKYLATGQFARLNLNLPIKVEGGSAAHVPNDTRYSSQWALNNDSITVATAFSTPARIGADMRMENAWDCEKGDTTIIVAIIDTGCKTDHPELSSRLWTNYGEIPNDNIDNDGNGHIDDIHGWDFRQDDKTLEDIDSSGHGTGIAGAIGARSSNASGLSGVDLNCRLMIAKFTNYRGATITPSDLDSAFKYSVNNGADVICFAYVIANDDEIKAALQFAHSKNVLVVTITGNKGTDADTIFPAAYPDSIGLLVVGATGPDDRRSNPFLGNPQYGGSNHTINIDVTAPGDYILTLDNLTNNQFYTVGGTSAAAAHVTGLAALLKSQNPSLIPDSIAAIIKRTADDQVGDPLEDIQGFDRYYGYGRVNAERALCGTNAVTSIQPSTALLSIFPNPSTGKITVTVANVQMKSAKVKIHDVHGRLVLAQDFNAGPQIAIDLPPTIGLYMVEVIVNDRLRGVAKVLRIE